MKHRLGLALAGLSTAIAALLAACSSTQPPPTKPDTTVPPPGAAIPPGTPEQVPSDAAPVTGARSSSAATARAYRKDGASHLYGLNRDRIYKGRLPPLLYAIGVLQVELDARGNVRKLSWMRAPSHAPEVVKEIERTVKAASPFPAPARLGKVVYTDTWLWHKSGKFQLDTLTEGQN